MRTIVDVLRESTGQLSQFIGLYNFGIYLFELEDASLIYTAMTLSKGFRTVDCTWRRPDNHLILQQIIKGWVVKKNKRWTSIYRDCNVSMFVCACESQQKLQHTMYYYYFKNYSAYSSASTLQPHSYAAIPSQDGGFARLQLPEALRQCWHCIPIWDWCRLCNERLWAQLQQD